MKDYSSLMLGIIPIENANNNKVLNKILSVRENFVLDEDSQR